MEAVQPTIRVRTAFAPTWSFAVWAGTVVYAVLLSLESIADHNAFTTSFDLAHYDQLLWLLAHGEEPFSTVVTRPLLADHFQPALALLTPLYWLGLGVPGILAAQAIALGLTAPALFALARASGAAPALAALPAFLWLVCPWTAAVNLFDFHPLAFSAPLLVLSVLAGLRDRHVLLLVTTLLALSLKEDVALMYIMLGLLLAYHGKRRIGGLLAAGSALWFVFAFAVVGASGNANDAYGRRFAGDRGDSLFDALGWMSRHPLETISDIAGESLAAVALLLVSTACLAFLAPAWILLSAPTALHNALSAYEYQHVLGSHYHLGTLLGFFVAAAVGVGKIRILGRPGRLAVALLVTVAVGAAALGGRWVHDADNERTRGHRQDVQLRQALKAVPDDAAVAATSTFLPHLSQRAEIYSLPEPFVQVDWGSALTRTELAERAEHVDFVLYREGDVLPWPHIGDVGELRGELARSGFVELELESGASIHVLRRDR